MWQESDQVFENRNRRHSLFSVSVSCFFAVIQLPFGFGFWKQPLVERRAEQVIYKSVAVWYNEVTAEACTVSFLRGLSVMKTIHIAEHITELRKKK